MMSAAPSAVFRIYLLRHAKAGPALAGQTDFDRTLDDTGFAHAQIMANIAADRGLVPDLILSSKAMRCRQTADAFRQAMSETIEIRHVDTLYSGNANVYRDLITAQLITAQLITAQLITAQCSLPSSLRPASVMIVGHNPVIEEVMSEILGDQMAAETIPGGYPPGALAAIDIETWPSNRTLLGGALVDWIDPGIRN